MTYLPGLEKFRVSNWNLVLTLFLGGKYSSRAYIRGGWVYGRKFVLVSSGGYSREGIYWGFYIMAYVRNSYSKYACKRFNQWSLFSFSLSFHVTANHKSINIKLMIALQKGPARVWQSILCISICISICILDPALSEGVLCNQPCPLVRVSVRCRSLNISDTFCCFFLIFS